MSLQKTVESFRRGILGKRSSVGMCMAVCAPLQSLLGIGGLETELTEGFVETCVGYSNHFWLTLPDGRIIDPTYDQVKALDGYHTTEVYIGPKPFWFLSAEEREGAEGAWLDELDAAGESVVGVKGW